MFVHLKQSGELLTRPDAGTPWTAPEVALASERIAELQATAGELGVRGLMVISGAGNIIRGAGLKREFPGRSCVQEVADAVARLGTVQNAVVLSAGLSDLGVPSRVLVSPNMHISDPSLVSRVSPYSERSKQAAYLSREVVLIAGGAGLDNQTTDAAIMQYARQSADINPDTEHRVLKATRFNGVFTADPRYHADAGRYDQISAGYMLTDYDRFKAVDRPCLEELVDAPGNISMQVYAAGEYTPLDALTMPEIVGTRIVSGYAEPVPAGV